MFAMGIKLFTDDQYYFSKILCTTTDIHVDCVLEIIIISRQDGPHIISEQRSINNPRDYPDSFLPDEQC